VLGVVTVNKLSRLFSDRLQCGPKKSVPVSTHLQNSGYWGRRQVAKNVLIEVFRCLVEICPPLSDSHNNQSFGSESGSAGIRIVFGGWIRIRIHIGVKSWIWMYANQHKSQNSLALEAQIEPWRAVDAQNRALYSVHVCRPVRTRLKACGRRFT
jgi:hypothetical protein